MFVIGIKFYVNIGSKVVWRKKIKIKYWFISKEIFYELRYCLEIRELVNIIY